MNTIEISQQAAQPLEVRPEGGQAYALRVESGWTALRSPQDHLAELAASRFFLITQPRLRGPVLETLLPQLADYFPGGADDEAVLYLEGEGESAKRFEAMPAMLNRLIELGADRRACILAAGGGVVGDFAGFVAAVLLRGVRYVQLPTTLLAAVDSSVGGKTAVNVDRGKNMVGAFHHPAFVYFNPETLRTLPHAEWVCGLAEMVKHAALERSGAMLARLEAAGPALRAANSEALRLAVLDSVAFKARVVSADEREGGLRAILNLGHTTAHAIESLTEYRRFSHGETVSRGLLTALLLSRNLLDYPESELERIVALMQSLEMPLDTAGFKADDLLYHMRYDKKGERGVPRFVLLEGPGRFRYGMQVDEAQFRAAWSEQRERFG